MGASISHGGTLRDSIPRERSSTVNKSPSSSKDLPLECPVRHDGAINPLNRMPELSQGKVPGQKIHLSVERTTSSIPRSSQTSEISASPIASTSSSCPVAHTDRKAEEGLWVYPSPQQFHNALVRKGKGAPEESVSTMVTIHNWLNESAWTEIKRWESKRDKWDIFVRSARVLY